MRYLRQNTATIVSVGPFFDKTDGVTLETALTITNERISFLVDLNDGSAPTLVLDNVTGATSGTDNDLNYITNCDAGMMQLELSAANTNYVGRAFLTVADAANHCPVFHEFTILPANVYDSLVLGTDLLDANASQVGGTSQTGRDIGASVLLSPGTGTGQVSLSNGEVTPTTASKTGYALTSAYDAAKTAATQTSVDTIDGIVDTIVSRVVGTLAAGTHNPQSGDAYAIANNGTYGNSALRTLLTSTGVTLTSGERTTLAAAIEAAIINELDGTAVMQAIADLIASDMTTTDLTVAAIASACRDAILNRVLAGNHDTSGTTGKVLQDIVADTNELQTDDTPGALAALQSHGDSTWATATGFSTHDAAAVVSAMQAVAGDFKADVSGLATGISLATLKTLVDKVAVVCIGNVTGAGTDEEVFTFAGVTATVSPDEAGNRTIVFS